MILHYYSKVVVFSFCFSILIFEIIIYSSDGKAKFLASLLQSSVSNDPSEITLIWRFGAQETFLIIISFRIL